VDVALWQDWNCRGEGDKGAGRKRKGGSVRVRGMGGTDGFPVSTYSTVKISYKHFAFSTVVK
jgi:hypothetical protein